MKKVEINNVKNNINNLLFEKFNIGFGGIKSKFYKTKNGDAGWFNMFLYKDYVEGRLCEIEFEFFEEIKSFIEELKFEGVKIEFDKKSWVSSKEDYEKVILGEGLCWYFGIDKFEGSYEDYLKFLYENKKNIWGGFVLKIII